MRPSLAILTSALVIPLVACRTTVSVTRAPLESVPMASALPERAFELVEAGRVVGVIVEFVELRGSRRFFSVRNEQQQELGLVDQDGRWWRYVAHAEKGAEWIGTGTVLEGAARILGVSAECAAYEVDLELLKAPARSGAE